MIRPLIILFITSLLSIFSNAATISSVKKNQIVIEMQGEDFFVGDEFFVINPETNKRTGIIRILKLKRSYVLAKLIQGKAENGYSLIIKPKKSNSKDQKIETSPEGPVFSKTLKSSFAFVGSYLMNTMSAIVSYKSSNSVLKSQTDMTGTGLSLGAFYDSPINSLFVMRLFTGYEQFSVSGSTSTQACNGSYLCNANIDYLSFYGLGKIYLNRTKVRNWLGLGGGYLLAISKSSSALNTSQISSNQVLTLAYGFDYQVGRKNYFPLSVEYNVFPDSETVKANQLILRAGWAWNH